VPDYAKMYHKLFNAMTDAIEVLQQAQRETEEMYVSAKEPEIHLLHPEDVAKDDSEK
jgi:hypothetical protein